MQITKLPDRRESDFLAELVRFGHFLEANTRSGCRHDLKVWPNQLWLQIQERMLEGFKAFVDQKIRGDEILLLQWYNSGIFLKSASGILGLDIVPIPGYYGWPEPQGFTDAIASAVDGLLITHNHQDHYDKKLAEACLKRHKPVLAHPQALDLSDCGNSLANGDQQSIGAVTVKAAHSCHVWRDRAEDVYISSFQLDFAGRFRMLFCGDSDYTKGFPGIQPGLDLICITWRNPGPVFEDGHPLQTMNTNDAVMIMINELKPCNILLQHYGELDHIYRGFTASYDLAAHLINSLPVPTDILFWGETKIVAPGS